jgi:DNA-binding transcriptional LysR family regulator
LCRLRLIGRSIAAQGRYGNTLTTRAESLKPLVTEALRAISSLFAQEVFEAGSARLTLRVAATDNGAPTELAPLLQQLATLAPHVTIDVSPWSA